MGVRWQLLNHQLQNQVGEMKEWVNGRKQKKLIVWRSVSSSPAPVIVSGEYNNYNNARYNILLFINV